jgi:hypothetical protein
MIGVGGVASAMAVFSSSKIMPVASLVAKAQKKGRLRPLGTLCLQQSLCAR